MPVAMASARGLGRLHALLEAAQLLHRPGIDRGQPGEILLERLSRLLQLLHPASRSASSRCCAAAGSG